jgi:hypothetical protein
MVADPTDQHEFNASFVDKINKLPEAKAKRLPKRWFYLILVRWRGIHWIAIATLHYFLISNC